MQVDAFWKNVYAWNDFFLRDISYKKLYSYVQEPLEAVHTDKVYRLDLLVTLFNSNK